MLLMYIVRTAALLKAVYVVDKDAVLEVLEQVSGLYLDWQVVDHEVMLLWLDFW